MRPRRRKGIYSRRTPFGAMRLTPAPPNVSCVICCANNLYPSGPSPYPCPGVDTPSGIDTLSPMPRTHLMPRTEAEGVCSETYGHPRPYKREGPEDGASRLWEGSERSGDGFGTNTLWRRKCSTWNKITAQSKLEGQIYQRGRCRRCGRPGRWWRGGSV